MQRAHRRTHRTVQPTSNSVGPEATPEQAPWGNAALAEHVSGGGGGEVGAQHHSPDHIDLGGDHVVRLGPHELTTGQLNALADYVADPADLIPLSAADLARGLQLIEIEHPSPAQQAEILVIFPAYADLSLDNGNHFAASHPALAEPSGQGGPNHRTEILGRLTAALGTAIAGGQQGDAAALDVALAEAAFAGHFVADAFSSGHLFNKYDVQAAVIAELKASPQLVPEMVHGAAGRIATEGADKLCHWRYVAGAGVGPELTTPVTRAHLELLLAVVVTTDPDLFSNGVVLAAHDALSASGVEVTDGTHTWRMFGDGALDPESQVHCEALIEDTYDLVRSAFAQPDGFDVAGAVHGILTSLPVPTLDGAGQIRETLDWACSLPGGGMEDAVVAGSVSMLDVILELASEQVPGRFVRVDDPSCGPGAPEHEAPEHDGPELHVVQPGEWLSTIAEEHYGDPMRYDAIFEANTDRIEGFDDPDLIEPGWALEIPDLEVDGELHPE